MPSRVLVTLPLPEAVLAALSDQYELRAWNEATPIPAATLQDWLQSADGILCGLSTPLNAEAISSSLPLKVVSSISVGVDHIDLDAMTSAGIPVGHTPGVLVDSTADMAMALILAVTRRIAEADRFVRNGQWTGTWNTGFFLGTDVSRATVGLVGMGPIGQAVARRLQGFGARVIAWNRSPRDVPGVEWVQLDELFARADIVSLHTALNAETAGLVSADRLAAMRDGAILINTARGGLVDETALAAELTSGRLKAGLDVFAEEPLAGDSPLLNCDNAVLVPHLGSATGATRRAMLQRALDNLQAGLQGDRLPWCANAAVYDD
jgi:glyoxylate reductase